MEISNRLGTTAKQTRQIFPTVGATENQGGKVVGVAVMAGVAASTSQGDLPLATDANTRDGPGPGGEKEGEDNNNEDGNSGELEGAELLDACDRLEQDNIRLRERLATLELQSLQREHNDEEGSNNIDARLTKVCTKSHAHEVRAQCTTRFGF